MALSKMSETHPLRAFKKRVDAELRIMRKDIAAAYSHTGRPGIPAEQLIKATLLQALYSIRSERQLCEQTCPVRRVSAGEIEKAVMEQLSAVFRVPTLVARTFQASREQESDERQLLEEQVDKLTRRIATAREDALGMFSSVAENPDANGDRLLALNQELAAFNRQLAKAKERLKKFGDEPISERHVVDTFQTLETFWDDLFPAEKNRLIHLLVESVTVREDGLDIVLKTNGLNSLVMELLTYAVEVEGRATA